MLPKSRLLLVAAIVLLLGIIGLVARIRHTARDEGFVSYRLHPARQEVQLYWKDDNGRILGSIQRLRQWLAGNGKTLIFAMNASMYKPDHSPQGLFINNGKVVSPLDTATATGNFYLKPNGIFYITPGHVPVVCTSAAWNARQPVSYATQSGPMLVIDGHIHPAFNARSANVAIRNGVGILPDGKVLFAMSTHKVSFYALACYFKSQGCKNALYLDGFVSRTYLPEQQWEQTDGDFGVIIGVTIPSP